MVSAGEGRRRRWPRAVLALATVLFAVLAAFVVLAGSVPADAAVREALLSMASPRVLGVFRIVNHAGDPAALLPGAAVLLAFPEARRRWWVWLGLLVVAPLAETALKAWIARPRPESPAPGFPSGHATAAAALFGAVLYLAGSLGTVAAAIVRTLSVGAILLVGAARVMLRAHWPSDVAAGIALGLALASLAAVIAASGNGARARSP